VLLVDDKTISCDHEGRILGTACLGIAYEHGVPTKLAKFAINQFACAMGKSLFRQGPKT
jgi:hypothetical protein